MHERLILSKPSILGRKRKVEHWKVTGAAGYMGRRENTKLYEQGKMGVVRLA